MTAIPDFDHPQAGEKRLWPRFLARAALSLAMAAGFLWLLADRLAQIDRAALALAFGQIGAESWPLALGLTGLSFWAVGHYDAVVHRHFATGLPEAQSRHAGICAIAVSQTLGLGLVTGAILRWRMLPGISLWQATRLTAAVALSFLAGWAVVTALVLALTPGAPFKPLATLALLVATYLAGLSVLRPKGRLRWPNAFTLARLIGLCAVDTVAAAAAFHVFLPVEAGIGFAAFLPAFLLALGAGLALGTPGGMGAFEVTLLALLPSPAEAPLLAALLGWRVVYYALPALLGAALALRGPERIPKAGAANRPAPHPRAESGLAAQGQVQLERVAGETWLLGRTGHSLIALFDPAVARSPAQRSIALETLRQKARTESRLPAVYKASARLAVTARRQGWAIRRTGWEAWLDPQTFRLAPSSRAGLRRKLRRAEAAGLSIRPATPDTAPWPALDRLAQDWARRHGGERGFSTGRHDRAYLSRQRLFIAWAGDQPVAFASFHTTPAEWALDLIRHGPTLPDGTIYALIVAAIEAARAAGIRHFSLAAVPEGAIGQTGLATHLLAALAPETAHPGLYRFKASFAPRWTPLYLIAPNKTGLLIAGASLGRAICRPPPLPRPPELPEIEQDDAEYGFASAPAPWHIARNPR